jgi:hypothetical protein
VQVFKTKDSPPIQLQYDFCNALFGEHEHGVNFVAMWKLRNNLLNERETSAPVTDDHHKLVHDENNFKQT